MPKACIVHAWAAALPSEPRQREQVIAPLSVAATTQMRRRSDRRYDLDRYPRLAIGQPRLVLRVFAQPRDQRLTGYHPRGARTLPQQIGDVLVPLAPLKGDRDDLQARCPLHTRSGIARHVMIEHRPLQETTVIGQSPRVWRPQLPCAAVVLDETDRL
jgi:hypothetical protein